MSLPRWLRESPRRPVRTVLVAVLCFGLIQANWIFPVLRFDSAALNHLFLLLAFTLSCLALLALGYFPEFWQKLVALLVLLPILAYTLIFAPFTAAMTVQTIFQGYDSSFQPIGTAPMDGYRVTIFRTDCGATCSWGVALRQERQLVPGVLLVRTLDGFYPAYDADYV
jgi:hypothetical protein